jgi:hypothetical protein
VFRYRLHSPDGDDLGEATYAVMIKSGEEVVAVRRVKAVPKHSLLRFRGPDGRASLEHV